MYAKFFTFVLLIIFSLTLISFAADKPEYVGANKCKTCHKAEKNGQQYNSGKSFIKLSLFRSLRLTSLVLLVSGMNHGHHYELIEFTIFVTLHYLK